MTKAVIFGFVLLFEQLFRMLLRSTGRVALTSGDFMFLFTTWQGILIILLGIAFVFVYFSFDMNTKIVMGQKMIKGEKLSVWKCLRLGAAATKRYFTPRGFLLVFFITFIAPLAGIQMMISLTERLQIPNFIMSVVDSKLYFSIPVRGLLVVFFVIGTMHIFILHGVVLDGMSVRDAAKQSRQFLRRNWKNFVKESLKYILIVAAVSVVLIVVFALIPWAIVTLLPLGVTVRRWLLVFIASVAAIGLLIDQLLVLPLYIMHITKMYYSYKNGEETEFPEKPKKKRPIVYVGVIGCAAFCTLVASIAAAGFEDIFCEENKTVVVAHRAGGSEGPENTVAGLDMVGDSGIYGCEIDIQRTKDGQYVINHDNDFKRVTGDSRKSTDMTLEECKQLRVDGAPVSSFEEMLDACHKYGVVLFTELKGETADRKMADDAVRIVTEKGMQDEVVIISLKYDLIDYIEDTYDDMKTGYLTFASFGDTGSLNCDYLAIEEEMASTAVIDAIHDQGKKVMIWTPNTEESQKKFLLSDADAIITDKVFDSQKLLEELNDRSESRVILDALLNALD